MVESGPNTLFLIDTYSIIFRAYYALPPFVNSSGFQTNAVYGVIKSLAKMRKDFNVKMMCAVYDSIGPTFRKELTETYKANRAKTPEDLIKQFPVIEKMIELFGIPSKRIEGFEADDVIGSISEQMRGLVDNIVIITGDKDLFQLINSNVSIYDPRKDMEYDEQGTFDKFGVFPSQMRDYLSLVGDSSDNIPGAPGIGPKTAVKLLDRYGNLEEIILHKEELTPGQQKSLKEFSSHRELTEELVRIRTDLDISKQPEEYIIGSPQNSALIEKFRELEFHSFISELDLKTSKTTLTYVQSAVFRHTEKTAFKIIDGDMLLVSSNREFTVLPLEDAAFDPAYLYISYNIKDDFKILMKRNYTLAKNYYDAAIAHHVLKGGKKVTSFHDMTEDFPLSEHISFENDPGKGGELLENAGHLHHLLAMYELQRKFSSFTQVMEDVLIPIEFPLIPVLAAMELNGISIDRKKFNEVKGKYRKITNTLERDIIEISGEQFNVDSPKQLSSILFNKLGLPILKKTKTGASTNSATLKALMNEATEKSTIQLLEKVLKYREVKKILSTYLEGFVKHIRAETGKIHTTYLQGATSTGRLSSENPNLQNLPIKTETGSIMRSLFVPSREGDLLLSLDYSQIELRILAHLTQDNALVEAFKLDKDIHIITAAKILSLPLDSIGQKERAIGKTINFGIMYGMGPYHLSQTIGISIKEAVDFIDSYYREYVGVKEFQDRLIAEGEKTGHVETFFHRKRYVPELLSSEHNVHASGVRVAINAPIQGTASEIVKLAMIKIAEGMHPEIRMLLQIHDELVFEGPEEVIKQQAPAIAELMESIVDFSVPLKVDHAFGRDLLEIH